MSKIQEAIERCLKEHRDSVYNKLELAWNKAIKAQDELKAENKTQAERIAQLKSENAKLKEAQR